MNTDTGSRLASLRKARGLSQEELAARIRVSRQAVSNWERSESLPDTANLVRLAEVYGVTLDELVGLTCASAIAESRESDVVEAHGKSSALWLSIGCVFASLVYYSFIAQPLMQSTVNDVAEVFGLGVGPALAVLWFWAEVVFLLLPFALLAVVPVHLPLRIWLAPLGVLVTALLISFGTAALSGSGVSQYSGIGGALMSSVAIKADVLSVVIGCLALMPRAAGATLRR